MADADAPVQNRGLKREASVQCGNLTIEFPFVPYEAQKIFMSRAVDAMESSSNALLESPTGTGKTLCLLCSTLAWRKMHDKQRVTVVPSVSSVNVDIVNGKQSRGDIPVSTTIVYASRTHSQLQQVVSELKSSVYAEDVKLSILGSRDQLCSNKKIRSKNSGTALTNACNLITLHHKCPHKNKFDSKHKNADGASTWLGGLEDSFMKSSIGKNPVMDVEELVSLGEREEVCSFFHSRAATKTADLILMPYNYLFNRRNQRALSIGWNNAVVVIDEAHNIESAACESLSKTFSSADIGRTIAELQTVARALRDGLNNAIESMLPVGAPDKAAVMSALKAVFEVEKRLDSVPLSKSGPGPKDSCHYPAEWLSEMFASVGFTADKKAYFLEQLDLACDLLAVCGMLDSKEGAGVQQAGTVSGKEAALVKFLDLLYLSYPSQKEETNTVHRKISDCVVYICEGDNKSQSSASKKPWILNFWCFSAGKALKQLKGLGVRSLLLASGTLSPMGALKADFDLPFPIELENKHVIRNSQIWVSAVSKGPSGGQLNSTMKNRGLNTYKDELGNSIIDICLTMLGKGISNTPKGAKINGGVLVFFPTYFVMEDCIKRWKESGVWMKLEVAGGAIFVEPRGGNGGATKPQPDAPTRHTQSKGSSKAVPSANGRGSDPANAGKSNTFESFISSFESAVKRNGNALLLAVCQGKVSEGIDFTNEKGRAVVVTGIPYAPIGDAWIVLKRQYLDEKARGFIPSASSSASTRDVKDSSAASVYGNFNFNKISTAQLGRAGWSEGISRNKSSLSQGIAAGTTTIIAKPAVPSSAKASMQSGNKGTAGGVSGETWYSQTASRAVNQALGRIIRHKDDWGAIFLLDDRFERENQRNQLSSWIRPRLQKHSDFSQCLQSFRNFLTVNSPAKTATGSSEIDGTLFASVPAPRVPTDPDRQKRKQAIRESNLGNKKVTVNRDVLPNDLGDDEGGISFINPDFFLSQQQSKQPAVAPCEAARRKAGSTSVTNSAPAKPRSMSEMLKTKKDDPFAVRYDKPRAEPQPPSSLSTSRLAGGSQTGSTAQDLFLSVLNSGAIRGASDHVSIPGVSKSNVFNFGVDGRNPWIRVHETTKPGSIATSGPPAKQGQQTLHTFMKKRSISSPPAQSGNAPTNSLKKKAKQSPDSQADPLDLLDSIMAPRGKPVSNSVRGANIICGVCRHKDPEDACTAKACGHICCKPCWVSWLRVNKSCPLCKVPVTEDSIMGLHFK